MYLGFRIAVENVNRFNLWYHCLYGVWQGRRYTILSMCFYDNEDKVIWFIFY